MTQPLFIAFKIPRMIVLLKLLMHMPSKVLFQGGALLHPWPTQAIEILSDTQPRKLRFLGTRGLSFTR